MHRERIVALDEMRFVAVTDQQRLQFFVWNARQNRGIRDLVAVEVQHRQNSPIADRVQEFVRMPGGCEWTGLRLAVAYCDGDDEIGVIECGSVGMRDGVAQLAAFVDRARRLRRAVRANSSRERKLTEELEKPRFIAA